MDGNNLDSISDSILTLVDLSAVAVASHFSILINVKKKIEDFLEKLNPAWHLQDHKLHNELYLSKLLNGISDAFSEELNRQNLPEVLKPKVLDKGLKIAERIHDWILHLISDLKLERKYTDKIYLTVYGEIDVDEIFKSHWKSFHLDKPSERTCFDDRISMLHYLACNFFQEEYIFKNHTDIINEIHTITPLEMNNGVVYTIMKFLICATIKARQRTKYHPSATISAIYHSLSNLELLNTCWSLALYKPFIYFWDYLNESQKSKYLINISRTDDLWFILRLDLKANYVSENLLKIIIFLTDKMSAFLVDNFISQLLCRNFPCLFKTSKCLKKFCTLLVQKFLPRLSEKSEYDFLNWIFGCENGSLKYVYISDRSLFKYVISHEIYKNRKDYILDFGRERYENLISVNNFKRLNELMDLSSNTENEKNHFKMRYNFLRNWISEEKWDVVNNVLEWMRTLSQTDKRNIILEQLKYPVEEKIMQKLLKWFAGTDSEPLINNCEDGSSVMNLTRDIIYKLWFSSENDSVANISSEILKCVFGTENEIINFKKTELALDEIGVVKFFCDTKLEMKEEARANFSRIDEFFNFCLSEEKIKVVKKLIKDDVEAWIENYGVSVRRFDIIVPLLDWTYGIENENCEMLKKYFKNHSDLENYYQRLNLY